MPEIDFGLLQPVNVGALTQQGFSTGMAMVKHVQTQNALKGYLANPDDPQAYSALAAYDPASAATILQQRREQQQIDAAQRQAANRRAAGMQAATGDVTGAKKTALAGGDFELVDTLNKMGDDERKATIDKYTGTAPIAYQAAKLPYEARKAFIQASAPELKALGWTDEQLSAFDPNDANLAGIVGVGSKISDLVSADKPQLVPFVPGGGVAALQNGHLSTLVAPNAGGEIPGAPVGTPHAASTANRPPPPDMHSVAALGSSFGTVTSTTRSPQHNQEVGGVSNSYHLTGHAIDIVPKPGVSLDQVVQGFEHAGYHVLEKLNEGDHIHIAVSGGAAPAQSEAAVRAAAEKAISLGADPAQVRARAAAQGVHL